MKRKWTFEPEEKEENNTELQIWKKNHYHIGQRQPLGRVDLLISEFRNQLKQQLFRQMEENQNEYLGWLITKSSSQHNNESLPRPECNQNTRVKVVCISCAVKNNIHLWMPQYLFINVLESTQCTKWTHGKRLKKRRKFFPFSLEMFTKMDTILLWHC